MKSTRCSFAVLCPAGAIEGSLTHLILPSMTKLAILVLIVLAMFFTWRPWCTLFCPLGAIYSLLNHVSFLFLRFHRDRCIECADCRSLCVDGGPAKHASMVCTASAAPNAPTAAP